MSDAQPKTKVKSRSLPDETARRIIVLDTSTLISAALIEGSIPDQATRLAFVRYTVAYSEATLRELEEVVRRPKIWLRVGTARAEAFLRRFRETAIRMEVTHEAAVSRDRDDDKFLALALTVGAVCIVSSDRDLQDIGTYKGIAIYSPAQFLEQERSRRSS